MTGQETPEEIPEEQAARDLFSKARRWHDDGVAWSLVDPVKFVGLDRKAVEKAVEKAAIGLARAHPYLVRDPELPDAPLPLHPTGTACGSGRRFYGRPVADDATLRAKYKMDRF